ncbi:hypothetical protein E2C01_088827 [Portunus trituberculatus]|uniref:Uncharacterized protein n=1 Tax=Portunus trituberculatus TaxID=210409 RepID=A0A5B7JKM2_PORTR|nr:hypothetical protein [Portunus trituberculatus]
MREEGDEWRGPCREGRGGMGSKHLCRRVRLEGKSTRKLVSLISNSEACVPCSPPLPSPSPSLSPSSWIEPLVQAVKEERSHPQ